MATNKIISESNDSNFFMQSHQQNDSLS